MKSPIAKYQEIVTALKVVQGIRSVQRDVGQLEYTEETATPVMPCILLKNEGTEWDFPSHEGSQDGSTIFKITLLTSLASIQSIDLSKNIDLSHEILFDEIHKKTLKIAKLKRFSMQQHSVIRFEGGLALVTSAKYRSDVTFENEFYQTRTLRELNPTVTNAQIDRQFP